MDNCVREGFQVLKVLSDYVFDLTAKDLARIGDKGRSLVAEFKSHQSMYTAPDDISQIQNFNIGLTSRLSYELLPRFQHGPQGW